MTTGIIVIINTAITNIISIPGKDIKVAHLLKFTSGTLYQMIL